MKEHTKIIKTKKLTKKQRNINLAKAKLLEEEKLAIPEVPEVPAKKVKKIKSKK